MPSPEAVAKAMAAAVKNVILNPMSRAQGAKWLRQEARSFGSEQIDATTLSLTGVIRRDPTGYPLWMCITYGAAIEQGGKQLLPLLYHLGAADMRENPTGPTVLWHLRALAESRSMLVANTATPRQPPPPAVDPTDPAQFDAAAEAMRLHTLLSHPDSVDPDAVIYAILLLVANNGYQAQVSLRDGHPEGPGRLAALADELLSMTYSISGDSMGMQRRLRGAIHQG